MSIELTTIGEELPVETPPENSPGSRRLRWFELALVLVLSFGGFVLNSAYILKTGNTGPVQYAWLRWFSGMVQETACLSLLGYVLWRRRLQFKDIGLRWSWSSIGAGLLVAIVSYFAYYAGYLMVTGIHRAFLPAGNGGVTFGQMYAHPSLLAIPFALLNPFFEELIVRAYVMSEIKDLTNSWILAATASIAIQTSYHLYYGWDGALALGFQFLVFSIYFAKTRRVMPIIVAHGLFDVYGVLRMFH